MNRAVQVLRCKRTGNFVLNPQGTFLGFGAYVGINPSREVLSNATPGTLGKAIVELMRLSGATGFRVRHHDRYDRSTCDKETRRVKKAYGFVKGKMTTSIMARKFLSALVDHRHGQKSWVVQLFTYSSDRRSLVGGSNRIRVKHAAGASALEEAVRGIMKLERRR